MKDIRIVYGAYSYNAKSFSKYGNVSGDVEDGYYELFGNFTPRFTTSFEHLRLAERTNDTIYANPCEEYTVQLDGASKPYPAVWGDEDMAMLYSTEISDGYSTIGFPKLPRMYGAFSYEYRIPAEGQGLYYPYKSGEGLVLQIDCFDANGNSAKYSARGFTVEYDSTNIVYPIDVVIYTYDGNKLLQRGEFTEGDNLVQVCPTIFTPFNKAILVFPALNVPHASLRIKRIIFGREFELGSNTLNSVTRTQEFDPLFASLYASTVDISLNMRGKRYDFRANDSVTIYADNESLQTAFVEKATKNRGLWRVNAYDMVGVLENIPYKGMLCTKDKRITWQEVVEDICRSAQIEYDIQSDEPNEEDYILGFIPYSNCRKALALVRAAFKLMVDARAQKITIKKQAETSSKQLQTSRIFDDISIDEEPFVTSVTATAYSYEEGENEETLYTVSDTPPTSSKILVKFSEPVVVSSVKIKRGSTNIVNSPGVVTSISETHVEFYALGGDKIAAKKYVCANSSMTLENPYQSADDVLNDISYSGNTLISQNLLDKTANMCYDYYIENAAPSAEFTYALADEALQVGDSVSFEADGKQYNDMTVTRLTQSFGAGREFVKVKVN